MPRSERRPERPTVKIIDTYVTCVGEEWSDVSRFAFRERIYRFYRWLQKSGLVLTDINLDILQQYRRYLANNGACKESITQYMRTITPFIRWLSAKGMLGTTLVDLELEREKFPRVQQHVGELTNHHAIRIHKIYLYEFYIFLKNCRRKVEDIEKSDLRRYEQELRTQKPPRTVGARRMNMRCVHNHIRWLSKKGHLRCPLAELDVFREKRQIIIDAEIPDVAKDFLRLALAHKKRSTVRGYQTKLKHFYKYLNDRQISLSRFTRRDFEDFIKRFTDVDYRPATLQHAIGTVQIYLTWLYKCGHLEKDPEPIIENFPRPERPDTLPRYLLPDVDALLQKQLEESTNIVAIALHLMRRIGVRIGDLRSLRYDGLRQDERGYWYIKIPLGKLNMERLFPLDDKSLELVKKIKSLSLEHNGGREPEKLIIHPRGKPPGDADYHKVLYEISEKIRLDCEHSLGNEPLVSHRLRHTFATTLLNADLNLKALQELLGHRSLSMTFVYARIMPEKLRADYFKAVDKIKQNVSLPTMRCDSNNVFGTEILDELLGRLRARALEPGAHKKLSSIIRTTERLKNNLATIN